MAVSPSALLDGFPSPRWAGALQAADQNLITAPVMMRSRSSIGASAIGPLAAWLRGNDFDDDACLLRRVVDRGGRSRAYVNGAPATLAQLREAAEFLADIPPALLATREFLLSVDF